MWWYSINDGINLNIFFLGQNIFRSFFAIFEHLRKFWPVIENIRNTFENVHVRKWSEIVRKSFTFLYYRTLLLELKLHEGARYRVEKEKRNFLLSQPHVIFWVFHVPSDESQRFFKTALSLLLLLLDTVWCLVVGMQSQRIDRHLRSWAMDFGKWGQKLL